MIEKMKEIITIQKKTIVTDSEGVESAAWVDFYKCHAYINHLSGKERIAAIETKNQDTLYATIRYASEIKDINSIDYRVIFDGVNYGINASPDDERYEHKFIKLMLQQANGEEDGET